MSFLAVFYQDLKERRVTWFIFPLIATCAAFLLYYHIPEGVFYITILINLIFICVMFLAIYFYSRFRIKKNMSQTFGLGDGLMFLALTFTFPNLSFLILFVFSLIFSLLLFLATKSRSKFQTVPLAGYMSLFFSIVYIGHWVDIFPNPYLY